MKNIKITLSAIAIMSAGIGAAQDNQPRFEQQGELIKGTYYYEDGSIKQEGTYKNGKLHGQWISYGQDGEKNALAQYEEGNKTGKWFFWNDGLLTEVDYKKSRITEVHKYKSIELAVQAK